jgi:hypothetical protein
MAEDCEPIEDELMPAGAVKLDPYGRHLYHLASHEGRTRPWLDAFGRCKFCLAIGAWRANA